MDTDCIAIRAIGQDDASRLADFYNGLATESKRTFHPLGDTASLPACEAIIAENMPETGKKCDMVAIDGDRVVGWSFLWNLQAEIPTFGLGVADTYQGRRVGSRLMDAILAEAARRAIRGISLTVVQDNERARAMYERRGFVRQEAFVGEDGLPYYYMTAAFSDRGLPPA